MDEGVTRYIKLIVEVDILRLGEQEVHHGVQILTVRKVGQTEAVRQHLTYVGCCNVQHCVPELVYNTKPSAMAQQYPHGLKLI